MYSFEPVISIMRYGRKCFWKTFLKPICHLASLQNSGVPEYRSTANKCQWNEYYLIKILYYKSRGVAVSSMINKASFKHCSLTPKSPQTYPREIVFPSLLNVKFFHRFTTCQMSLILIYNPLFSMFDTRYQCNTSYMVFERTACLELVCTSSPAANYLSSECFVIWWVPSKCGIMSTLTVYFSRSWRQLFAFHSIDMEQGPP